MKREITFCVSAVTVLIAMSLFFTPAVQAQSTFRISGAGLLAGLTEEYVKAYSTESPGCKGGIFPATTGKGFKKFIAGEADLVMASRGMRKEEVKKATAKGMIPESKLLGKIAVAVITKGDNPVSELTMEQLRKIFTGEVTNWKEVGGPDKPIIVTTRAVPDTGTGVHFQKVVLKGAPYAPGHRVMPRYGLTMLVCSKSYAIGYVPTSTDGFYRARRGLKVIKVKMDDDSPAMAPRFGVSAGTDYPITIPFYMVWNSKSDKSGCLKGFADFSKSMVEKKVASTQ